MIQLDDQFALLIINLITQSQNNAEANLGLLQRTWRIPPDWNSSPTDIQALGDGFDRSGINETYQNIFGAAGGTAGDSAAAKLMGDHIAMQERAFRLRHATSVRRGMHAASRRFGQSLGGGSFGRIANHAQDLIAAGTV